MQHVNLSRYPMRWMNYLKITLEPLNKDKD